MQQTELLKAATQAWARRAEKGLTEVCLQRKAFISETGEQKRGVMWWRFRLSCFTVGDLERQMRRIAKSSQSFLCRGKQKMRQQNTGIAPHIKISKLQLQCETEPYS